MILERFYDEKLAQASYLVGCAETGDAIVVDANRDVAQYVSAARRQGVRIASVTETHIHADYVSGSRELAARTGAQLYLSGEGGPEWRYGFAEQDGATLVHDGDRIAVGNVVLEVVHTPGHTPEHVCFVVTDTAGADEPMGVLSGDFVFVGDVGRPDLLERAAGHAGTMEDAARALFRSFAKFRRLPEWTQVWPGHGAGSACGKSLGAVPFSTVGYELRFNWAFGHLDEDGFVAEVLAGQPEPPRYFAEMKRVNRDGPRVLGGFPQPERVADERLGEVLDSGATVVDTRRAAEFATGHVPGTVSIPLNRSFTTYAGSLLSYDGELYLVGREASVREAARDLAMIGHDRVAGWFDPSAIESWRSAGRPIRQLAQVDADGLRNRLEAGDAHLIDVRNRSEWDAGHVAGALHVPLGTLPDQLTGLPQDRPILLQCATGARSAIAASLLLAHGFESVANQQGGFEAWRAQGLPVETLDTAG